MILSRGLLELRDLLDDPNKSKFSDATCVRTFDRVSRGLFRQLVDGNKDYSNFTMALPSTAAVQVLQNVWEFRVPSWVMHVVDIFYRDGDPTTATTLSPYLWTGATSVRIGTLIPRFTANESYTKWGWEGSHTIRLYNFSQVPNLILRVAVRPPTLLMFTVDAKNASASKITLPVTPTIGELELEEGAYINAEFQVTATNSETSANIGLMRRGIYSTAGTNVGGNLRTEVTMDAAWSSALSVDDVVESVLPIPDEHCRYLILSTAMACYQRKPNVQAMRLISGEMAMEGKRFNDYATSPRDRRGPSFIQRGRKGRNTWFDPDRTAY